MQGQERSGPELPDELAVAITTAARAAFTALFAAHPGRYYYCSLVTTGEGHRATLSAWSIEALSEATKAAANPAEAASMLRWSYADSPCLDFGADHFAEVEALIDSRPGIDSFVGQVDDDGWNAEWEARAGAMEAAMRTLDHEGVFGTGAARDDVVVLVEVIPPDHTNTERAIRLNPRAGRTFQQWMAEAAEPSHRTASDGDGSPVATKS